MNSVSSVRCHFWWMSKVKRSFCYPWEPPIDLPLRSPILDSVEFQWPRLRRRTVGSRYVLHSCILYSCVPAFLRSCVLAVPTVPVHCSTVVIWDFLASTICIFVVICNISGPLWLQRPSILLLFVVFWDPLTPPTFIFVVIYSILGALDLNHLHFRCYLQHFGIPWLQRPSFLMFFTAFWDPWL